MNRLLYLDWLRVFAAIGVVVIHASAGYVTGPVHELNWFIGNFFEALTRWAVPVFVMISGVLLLRDGREMPYWEFFEKRAGKAIIPFIAWSVLFYLYGVYEGYFPPSIKEGIKLFVTNEITYHFWFFYMIIGLYLITPLLKVFVRHAQKHHIEYFFMLWLYASVVTRVSDFWFGTHFSLELFFVTDYVGYFLLGYYLNQFDIPARWRSLSYIGLMIGMIAIFFLTYYYTVMGGEKDNQFWYKYFSPPVVLCSIGVFVLFRYHFNERPLPRLLVGISKASLGIYIIHYWLLNNYLWRIFAQVEAGFPEVLVIPINIGITFMLSLIIILILQRIPILNKLVP